MMQVSVIQRIQTLSEMIKSKASVGGFLSMQSNLRAGPPVETTKQYMMEACRRIGVWRPIYDIFCNIML